MSLNSTPSGERTHIGIFGKRNAGKSSVINAITDQNIAIVSDVKGTTTDPVKKAMELLPLGPVMIIDTPGIDDIGELGELRVKKGLQVLNKTDIAVMVTSLEDEEESESASLFSEMAKEKGYACPYEKYGLSSHECFLIERFKEKKLPFVVVVNKSDTFDEERKKRAEALVEDLNETEGRQCAIIVSAANKTNIFELKEMIAASKPDTQAPFPICGDLLERGDIVVLVIPIDKAAPKGRLILPQQQTIRDILDHNATALVVQDDQLAETIEKFGKNIRLVVTDSQVFFKIKDIVPEDIELTSFSILISRHKGTLRPQYDGARAIENLKDGDTVLIAEGCSHHRTCEDIGTVKLPKLIRQYTGKNIKFETCSGTEYPDNLEDYALIFHCGGCTLNEKEMQYRIKCAQDAKVPITNYGISIAYMRGIMERSMRPLGDKY
ncbi:MAG: [FeFe] hydrogenase H-cluster maturation GTPase HydF [Parasporobacterium sp.]|nr:[FeFe] hydrogenase H-cluster maturation GTPase HydF [Parasporobacterium sp.]